MTKKKTRLDIDPIFQGVKIKREHRQRIASLERELEKERKGYNELLAEKVDEINRLKAENDKLKKQLKEDDEDFEWSNKAHVANANELAHKERMIEWLAKKKVNKYVKMWWKCETCGKRIVDDNNHYIETGHENYLPSGIHEPSSRYEGYGNDYKTEQEAIQSWKQAAEDATKETGK